jgi:hypothetical protein
MAYAKPRLENQCSICRHVKSPSDFYFGKKRGKPYQIPHCKDCKKAAGAKDRAKRSDKIKAMAQANKEEIAAYQKAYRQKNSEKLKAFYRQRYLKRKLDPDHRRKVNEYAKAARDANPALRAKDALSARLSAAFSQSGQSKKCRRTLDFIGCSLEELRVHLESQFKKGMTWENRGRLGWHIDHIIPCSSFDHSDEKQVLQCWHFTNLRPMWWRENLSKGKRLTLPQMSLLL